ncbi:spore coat protein [Maledivibacter halophilus]|uniref:Coat F domain-containing protein n=1 Tax=Maledivibacter halophilus TaxID=36842 RepID=A0A1T5JTR8_9FIRM|nr:spore coat protein [Maledivibacter halophilus]SKC54770.1 Coat F domain-containing protein [Maledivibacter halophilus]
MSYSLDFSEKELLSDLLMSEEQITHSYTSSIMESTCPDLRNALSICLTNTQNCQFEILDLMNQRGWYKIKEADSVDIENIRNKFSILYNELS